MHEKNVENSFSQHLSDKLGVNLRNIALSGCSNDYIFFSVLGELNSTQDIHSLIVSWTSVDRLTWNNGDRYWMFTPAWAASIQRISQWQFAPWRRNIEHQGVWLNSDEIDHIDILKSQHRFFVENYLCDTKSLVDRLKFYSSSLQAICQQRNIRLIEITPFRSALGFYQIGKTQSWGFRGRHPTKEEHILIADEIYDKFYI
jgi:hypothetical protein